MRLLLGADPEVFMLNEQKLVRSAHGIIPGTKANPHPVPYGAIQVDGMALEFNIQPVEIEADSLKRSRKDWLHHLQSVMQSLRNALPSGYDIAIKSHHHFPNKYMESVPAEVRELGCAPDFNAYTQAPIPTPDAKSNMRTCAGHIHFGWTEDETPDDWFFNLCCGFTKELDASIGLFSWYLDPDVQRKALYGRAGSFRPKPYGLEYRTPSNAWLASTNTMRDVYDMAYTVFLDYKAATYNARYAPSFGFQEEDIPRIINCEITDSKTRRNVGAYLRSRFNVRSI